MYNKIVCICRNFNLNQPAFDLFHRQQKLALDSRFCRNQLIAKLNHQLVFASSDFKETGSEGRRFEL